MPRRRYSYLLAGADFIAFNLVIWVQVLIRPSIGEIYGQGFIMNILPVLIAAVMVGLLAIFRQYRLKHSDRFFRQFASAFNVVTMGFLIIVIISVDLGAITNFERGHLLLLLVGLLLATFLSRVFIYLWT